MRRVEWNIEMLGQLNRDSWLRELLIHVGKYASDEGHIVLDEEAQGYIQERLGIERCELRAALQRAKKAGWLGELDEAKQGISTSCELPDY